VPEDYIHRIGRTGRAGASGEAVSFVAAEEERHLTEIEHLLKKKIEVETDQGFVAPPAYAHGGERERGSAASRTSRGGRSSSHAGGNGAHRERGNGAGVHAGANGNGHAGRRPEERAERSDHDEPRRDWRSEREDAYARNPDQPIVRSNGSTGGNGDRATEAATSRGAVAGRPASRPARQVPVLLMKRPVAEPEKV
jgi:ATP-dependent RNA helicase RhlE